jgi:hypothetical protein
MPSQQKGPTQSEGSKQSMSYRNSSERISPRPVDPYATETKPSVRGNPEGSNQSVSPRNAAEPISTNIIRSHETRYPESQVDHGAKEKKYVQSENVRTDQQNITEQDSSPEKSKNEPLFQRHLIPVTVVSLSSIPAYKKKVKQYLRTIACKPLKDNSRCLKIIIIDRNSKNDVIIKEITSSSKAIVLGIGFNVQMQGVEYFYIPKNQGGTILFEDSKLRSYFKPEYDVTLLQSPPPNVQLPLRVKGSWDNWQFHEIHSFPCVFTIPAGKWEFTFCDNSGHYYFQSPLHQTNERNNIIEL